jgi:hypothetical protein
MGLDSINTSTKASVPQVKQQVAAAPAPVAPAPKKSSSLTFDTSSFEPAKAKAPVALTVPFSETKASATTSVAAASQSQVKEVDKAREALEDAKGLADDLDEKLAKELADFGPALTDEQRQAYVESFRGEHKALYQSVVEKAEALDALMKENGPALEAAAIKDGHAADVLYGAYKALANSPKAEEAAKFASKVLADPSSALAGAVKRFPKLEQEIAQPAISNAWTQFLSEEPDPDSALSRLSEIVKPYVEGRNASQETKEAWEALGQVIKTKKFDALEALSEAGAKSPLAKSFAAASMVLGAYEGFQDVQDGKYVEAVKNFASAGKDGMDVLKFGTAALKEAGLVAEGSAAVTTTFAAKLAPGLGVVASAISLGLNMDKVRKDTANLGTGLAITGDLLSLMGSGLAVIPGGQVPGSFFIGVGGVVGAVGSYVEGQINDKEMQADQRRGLAAAGITEPLLSTLVDGEPARMKELQEELGLDAQQIQQLALRYPTLITHEEGEGVSLANFKELKQDFGLSPQQSYELLLAVGNGTEDPDLTLSVWLLNLKDFGNATPEQWRQGFEERANRQTDGRHTYYNEGFRNALTYLESPTFKPGGAY